MKLPGRVWMAIHRVQNRWHDLLAILSGYCNDCPVKTGIPGETGGYAHWRCALHRGHDGKHRYRNAVWGDTAHVEHDPVDKPPGQSPERTGTPTMRQARNRRRWDEQKSAERRARWAKEGQS